MSDYNDMDRYLNLATSTSPSPSPPSPPPAGDLKHSKSETTGSFPKTPAAPRQPLSDHSPAPDMEGVLHRADDSVAQMTLHGNLLFQPYHQPMYRMVSSPATDHETDEVNLQYGDSSTCGSGISDLSLASPADSWASPVTSFNHYRQDGTWNDLGFSSPSHLSSTDDGDDIAAAPSPIYCPGHGYCDSPESDWHIESVAPNPLSGLVGMSVNSRPSTPVDGLSSSALPYMASRLTNNSDMIGVADSDDDRPFRTSEPSSVAVTSSSSGPRAAAARPTNSSSADGPPYAQLIYKALMTRDNHCMSLQEIYQWFRDNTEKAKGGGKGWQNSIRHNLSMNRGFVKRERKEALKYAGSLPPSPSDASSSDPKRSTEWTVQDWAITDGVQSTTRYRGSKAKGGSRGTRSRQTSSPGSPYPSAAAAADRNNHIHGPRVTRLQQRHGGSAGSAHGGMRLPPTSHYYPPPNLAGHASDMSDPYREQLMHEAMMRHGGYASTTRSGIKMESRPSTPPAAAGGVAQCYPVVGLPGIHHHGLMHNGSPAQGSSYPLIPNSAPSAQFPGVPQPAEFPFSTSHVRLYPSRGTPGAEDGNGEQQPSSPYDANGPHGLYPWNPNSGY